MKYGTPKNVTAQGIFNKVWSHFIVNKAPRSVRIDANDDYSCCYRSPEGAACAVGVLLTTKEVLPSWDKDSMKVSCITLPKRLRAHLSLLSDLQFAHDSYGEDVAIPKNTNRRKLERAFRRVARNHGLKIPC